MKSILDISFGFGIGLDQVNYSNRLEISFPSGGTCFLTNSPFTPAWDTTPVRPSVGTRLVSRLAAPSSTCPIHFRPCGSSPQQTPFLLPALGANGTSSGCVWSSNGRRHFSQGGWHSGYRSQVGIHLAEFPTLR